MDAIPGRLMTIVAVFTECGENRVVYGGYSSLAVYSTLQGQSFRLTLRIGRIKECRKCGGDWGIVTIIIFFNTCAQRGGDKTLSPPISVDLGSAFCQHVEEARNPQLLTG